MIPDLPEETFEATFRQDKTHPDTQPKYKVFAYTRVDAALFAHRQHRQEYGTWGAILSLDAIPTNLVLPSPSAGWGGKGGVRPTEDNKKPFMDKATPDLTATQEEGDNLP